MLAGAKWLELLIQYKNRLNRTKYPAGGRDRMNY